jgi:hypothetical protein
MTNIGKTIGHKDTRSDGRIDEEWKNRRRMEESTRNGLMMMNRGIRRLDATSFHLIKSADEFSAFLDHMRQSRIC